MSESDAPLPPGWSKGFSKSQKRPFFFHKETKHTQWHFPTASEAADPTKARRRAEMNKERETKKRNHDGGGSGSSKSKRPRAEADDFLALADSTSVAVIVPFRDIHPLQNRSEHLAKFIPYMNEFMGKLQSDGSVSDYHIYIINQSDDKRKFNRGKLLNIGYDMAKKSKRGHDVFIFHDVDLLPNEELGPWYAMFPKTPIHIARVWDRYSNNPNYIGGVVSFSSSDYKRINGYPNTFWGWGGEDDEMQKRLLKLGIKFTSPDKGKLKDLENMNIKQKINFLRENKVWKCMVKWEALDEHDTTWKTNGLADLNYSILDQKSLSSNNKATMITADVKLNGSHWLNAKSGIDYMPPPNR